MDVIVVNEPFERWWSFAADHAARRWAGPNMVFVRMPAGDSRSLNELDLPPATRRLLVLSLDLDLGDDFDALPYLEEVAFSQPLGDRLRAHLQERHIEAYAQRNEGYWGQSVAEFALGLTIAALRRIPQSSSEMKSSLNAWQYMPAPGLGRPGVRAAQFGDNPDLVSGTVADKRVRVAGMGNIGSRYAAFCHGLGADVAGWGATTSDPVFHRTGTRRIHRLSELVADAEIFAPMFPLVPGTQGIISSELVDALPQGCLIVLVTRAQVVDMDAIRRRVATNEILLAADVFDIEPLPLDDPLIGRTNVVHTPHNAGRTIDSNQAFANGLLDQFKVALERRPQGQST